MKNSQVTVKTIVKAAHDQASKQGDLNRQVKWAILNKPTMLAQAADDCLATYGVVDNVYGHKVCVEVANITAAMRYASKQIALEELPEGASAAKKKETVKDAAIFSVTKNKETGKYEFGRAMRRASGGGRKSEATGDDDGATLEQAFAIIGLITKGSSQDIKTGVVLRLMKQLGVSVTDLTPDMLKPQAD